jgi:hypothetical protein
VKTSLQYPILKKSAKKDLKHNKESVLNLESEIKDIEKEIKKYKQLIKGGTSTFNDETSCCGVSGADKAKFIVGIVTDSAPKIDTNPITINNNLNII